MNHMNDKPIFSHKIVKTHNLYNATDNQKSALPSRNIILFFVVYSALSVKKTKKSKQPQNKQNPLTTYLASPWFLH